MLGFPAGGRSRRLAATARGEVVLWHESPAEPPNLYLTALDGSGSRALTRWPDPHPQLTGMQKRLIVHDRGDGVQLSGMLHLPPGYDPATGRPPAAGHLGLPARLRRRRHRRPGAGQQPSGSPG